MAVGGPETSLALGRINIPIEEAVTPAPITDPSVGLGADMGVPPIMSNDGRGAYSTSTTGAAPAIPQAEDPTGDQTRAQAGGGGRTPLNFQTDLKAPQLNQNYRYSQRDFYGQNPNITFTDPRGVQMYVPSFGEVPYAVLGSQLQQLQKEKAVLKQRKDDLLNPKFDRTAPQYEAEFANYANQAIASEIASQTASFGGDRSAALNYLTEDPEGAQRWMSKMREINAVGQEAKYVADDWADILAQEAKGLLYLSPENKRIGEEIVRGYTSLGSDKEPHLPDFLNSVKQGKRILGRDQFVKQFIIPAIDELAQDTDTIEKPYRIAGGRLVIPVTDRRNYDQLIESQARAMTEMDQFDHVDEARQWLRDRFPADVKVQAIVRDPIMPSGGSGSQNEPKTGFGPIEKSTSRNIIEEGAPNAQFTPDAPSASTLRRAETEKKRVWENVGGRQQPMGARVFSDSQGNQLTIRPHQIESDGFGNFYATGDLIGDGQVVTYTTIETDENGNDKEVTKVVDTSKKNVPVSIYLNDQKATAETYFGKGWDEGFAQKKSSRRAASSMQTDRNGAPTFVLEAGYTEEDWSGLTDKQRDAILRAGKL